MAVRAIGRRNGKAEAVLERLSDAVLLETFDDVERLLRSEGETDSCAPEWQALHDQWLSLGREIGKRMKAWKAGKK
jgi:uncharacterized protein YhfF